MATLTPSCRFLPAIGLGLLLTACGGGGSSDSSGAPPSGGGGGTPTATVSGTAAVGAAITGATLTATCQDGSGFTVSPVTTDTNGKWSGKVESDQLPCLLELKNGTPNIELNSMVFAAGTANISPLTHLALVMTKTDVDFNWTDNTANWPTKTQLDASATTLLQALKDKGYADASLSGNPFTTAFDANGAGWDALLDNIRELVEDPAGSINGYGELAQLLADGNIGSLPDAPVDPDPDPTDPELPANINVLTAFAGTYTVSGTATEPTSRGTATRDHARGTITISANGDVDFDTSISFAGADINTIYDRRNICDLPPQADRAACRVHVNYDADDSGRKLEIFLALDKTTVLEIRYQDGQGGLTRAAIGSGTDPDPTDPPVVQSAVDPADLGSNANPTDEEFLTVMASQSWPVAIYQAPEDHPEWYGQGSLTIGGTTSNWTMELKGADGSVIASLNADGAFTNAFTPFYEANYGLGPIPMPGHIFINKGTAINEYLNVFVEQNTGLLEGSAGGPGEVKFRNSVVAYGAGIPAIFADLAGTWTGTWENWCVSPPKVDSNTITISEDGVVTLENTGSQGCDDVFPQSFSWGGYNDFLIPDPEETDGSYVMHVDATDFTNVSKGKLKIYFDADMNVKKFTASTPSSYQMKNPVKQ